MRIKSYFANTVESAITLARHELGGDALLVSARRSDPDDLQAGRYEVVFAVEREAARDSGAEDDPRPKALNEASKGLSDIRLQRFDLALEASQREARNGMPVEIASRLQVSPTLGKGGGPAKVALIGPSGAGKTSMLIKLAVRFGVVPGRRVLVASLDTNRVASTEPLRSYARLLGISFKAAEGHAELHDLLTHCDEDLVFIDTPGIDESNIEGVRDLAGILNSEAGIDMHLVVPASLRPTVIRAVIDRFQVFQFSKLLFTRFDETDCWTPLILEAARTRKPLSFWSTSSEIPDGFENASRAALIQRMLGTCSLAASAM